MTYLETDDEIRARVAKRFEERSAFFVHLAIYTFIIGLMWLIYLGGGGDSFPWPIITSLAWGSGLLGHGIDTWYKVGRPARVRDQMVWREMRRQYGDEWRVNASRDEYKEVQQSVGKPMEKRKDFFIHLMVYLCINAMLWSFWLPDAEGFPWPSLVSAFWGIGLVSDAIETFLGNASQRAIDREVAREMERLEKESAALEKPKRDQAYLRLSNDGELVEIIDEEENGKRTQQR